MKEHRDYLYALTLSAAAAAWLARDGSHGPLSVAHNFVIVQASGAQLLTAFSVTVFAAAVLHGLTTVLPTWCIGFAAFYMLRLAYAILAVSPVLWLWQQWTSRMNPDERVCVQWLVGLAVVQWFLWYVAQTIIDYTAADGRYGRRMRVALRRIRS